MTFYDLSETYGNDRSQESKRKQQRRQTKREKKYKKGLSRFASHEESRSQFGKRKLKENVEKVHHSEAKSNLLCIFRLLVFQ